MARKKINIGSVEEQKKIDLGRRILQIRQTFFDDNNRLYSDKICVNEQALSQICSGKRNAGIEIVQKILDNLEDIDANWLLTGKGEMMRENVSQSTLADAEERISELKDYNNLLREKVANLESELQREREKVSSLQARTNMEVISR